MTTATNSTGPVISDLQLRQEERVTTGGNSRTIRFLIWTVLFVLVVGGGIAYRRNPPWLQELRGTEYETVSVAVKGHDDIALEVSGFVVPYHTVKISPRIPGAIVKLPIEVGSKVQKGDLLSELDPGSYQADMQQAQAALQAAKSRQLEAKNGAQPEEIEQARIALDVAKSKLELVASELDRAELLGNTVTQAEMDQYRSGKKDAISNVRAMEQKLKLIEQGVRPERMQAIDSEVKQAEALVAKAQYLLDNTRILSPIDGTVLEKNAEVGEILRPEVLSVSLCSLADMSIMEVEIDVQERELQKIVIGRDCTVIPDAYADRKYAAKIDRFQPMVNRARGVVRVTLRITEPDAYLLPDMNVRSLIQNPPAEGGVVETLWLPDSAITRDGDAAFVFALKDERAVRTPVKLGATEGKRTQIAEGLMKDDVVVLAGGKRLVDGQAVRKKAKG
ncbi:MAG TPA: efflux RND transporter periplasmic adaptor subunit [Planctomycetaceae bacterium]|nr:efflux RND transporter periplasmic adaptor subunit [Planctomycetaceae bacterium]